MTIDEAIKNERAMAEENKKIVNVKGKAYASECLKRAVEHEQIADWLEELKARREDRWVGAIGLKENI